MKPLPDPTSWGPFDPNDPRDAACERERQAFTAYTLKRVQKKPRTGSDDSAIIVGALSSIVQVLFATYGNVEPPGEARQGLHDALDALWVQTAAIKLPGETVQ